MPTTEPSEERIAELHRLLVEAADPSVRARAHVELGRHALGSRRVDLAIRHFREALVLDRHLEAARQALHSLGEESQVREPSGRRRTALRSVLRRVLGRPDAV